MNNNFAKGNINQIRKSSEALKIMYRIYVRIHNCFFLNTCHVNRLLNALIYYCYLPSRILHYNVRCVMHRCR